MKHGSHDPDHENVCAGCGYIHEPMPDGQPCRWGRYSPNAKEGKPHGVLHYCEDGHHWTEHPDGGVSPSWGFGLTSIRYDQPPDRCPEPERGWSRYTDERNGEHGYKCPSCGEVHYVGGCGIGVRCDPWEAKDPPCEPPPPACGKPAIRTQRWLPGVKRDGVIAGWVDLEPQPGEQLALTA